MLKRSLKTKLFGVETVVEADNKMVGVKDLVVVLFRFILGSRVNIRRFIIEHAGVLDFATRLIDYFGLSDVFVALLADPIARIVLDGKVVFAVNVHVVKISQTDAQEINVVLIGTFDRVNGHDLFSFLLGVSRS